MIYMYNDWHCNPHWGWSRTQCWFNVYWWWTQIGHNFMSPHNNNTSYDDHNLNRLIIRQQWWPQQASSEDFGCCFWSRQICYLWCVLLKTTKDLTEKHWAKIFAAATKFLNTRHKWKQLQSALSHAISDFIEETMLDYSYLSDSD